MEICEEAESGYIVEPDDTVYVGSRMTDVEIIRESGEYVVARGRRYGRYWLLKGLREELRASTVMRHRLMKEFEIHSRLMHPYIARVTGFEEIDGLGQCIVEEWIEGDTLRNLMHVGSLGKKVRAEIMGEIIEAASYLHSRGVVHRDLKPSNIMVREAGGDIAIIDFGLADTADYTEFKQPAGTDGFVSPEQKDNGMAIPADDVYSLGVIMRELYPEYPRLARRCTSARAGRPEDAGKLLEIFNRRRHRPKAIATAAAIVAAGLIGGLLAWHVMSLHKSVAGAQSEVKALLATNTENEKKVVELEDSLSNVKARMSETSRQLEETRRTGMLKDSVANVFYDKVEMVLRRYDRKIISTISLENNGDLSQEISRIMKEMEALVDYYCSQLLDAGISEREIGEFRSSLSVYYLEEYDKYQRKWLKKIYPDMQLQL